MQRGVCFCETPSPYLDQEAKREKACIDMDGPRLAG